MAGEEKRKREKAARLGDNYKGNEKGQVQDANQSHANEVKAFKAQVEALI